MASKRRLHKYYRAHLRMGDVWACALPDCSHYMPQHMEHLVNGKATICWQCDEKTVMSPANMHMDRPICPSCALGATEEIPLSEAMKEFIAGKQ